MLVTVGTTTTRKGHKVHRHVNGWAACGAGKLLAKPRIVETGDQLCHRCAPHMNVRLNWEIDDMNRQRCYARAAMLETFVDSGKSAAELARSAAFVAGLEASLSAHWAEQERPKPLPSVDLYADTLTLF